MKRIRIGKNGRAPWDESDDEFYGYIRDLVHHPKVLEMKKYIHHGKTTCYQHCLNVAYYNYWVCKFFALDAKAAARAGMLHDLFLYDWHEHAAKTGDYFHGLTHPKVCLRNAKKYFKLTAKESDMIVKHMWPLTVLPPKYKEGYVICISDKYCGFCETAGDHIPKVIPAKIRAFQRLLKRIFGADYHYQDYRISSDVEDNAFVQKRKRPVSPNWKRGERKSGRRRR